jgi:hypothetical protein
MPSVIYNSALYDAWTGRIAFESDTFAVMLLNKDYTPDRRNHRRRSDVVDFEVEGQGYRSGGQRVSVAIDLGEDDTVDVLLGGGRWTQATLNARYALYYKVNGDEPEADELVACIDFASDIISTNGIFSLSESRMLVYQPE